MKTYGLITGEEPLPARVPAKPELGSRDGSRDRVFSEKRTIRRVFRWSSSHFRRSEAVDAIKRGLIAVCALVLPLASALSDGGYSVLLTIPYIALLLAENWPAPAVSCRRMVRLSFAAGYASGSCLCGS
jgi:hypothetical protein